MKITDEMLCVAMDAHRDWCFNNFTEEEMLQGMDGFAPWKAALEALFEYIESQNE